MGPARPTSCSPHLLERDFHDDLVGIYLPSGVHPSNLGIVPPDLEPRVPGSVLQQPALERDHLRGSQGNHVRVRDGIVSIASAT